MTIRYDYDSMLSVASRIERELPELIASGNWQEIKRVVLISEEIWEGPAAIGYNDYYTHMIEERNVAAIKEAPQKIRTNVRKMQETDAEVAKKIKAIFSQF